MSDQGFERFVTDHSAAVAGVVHLITDDLAATHSILDATWPEVFRRWPNIARSPHVMATALAPFVRHAVDVAEQADALLPDARRSGLELRDDLMLGATALRGQNAASSRVQAAADAEDPADRAVGEALADLLPRERALVALHGFVGLDDRELRWAVRGKPLRSATVMRRAYRDLLLTAAPQVTGPATDEAGTPALEHRVARVLAQRAAAAAVDRETLLAGLRPGLATITQHRPFPRLRPAWVVAVGAIAAAAVVGAFVVATGDDSRPTPAATDRVVVSTEPTAEPGMRLVGFHSVYTSVPVSWSHNHLACGEASENTVVYPDAGDGCNEGPAVVFDVPPSSVTFSEAPTNALVVGRLRQVSQVGDFGVYATVQARRGALLQRVVLIPKAGVQMVVRATDQQVMDDIVDSLQPVPDGYTVVPPCQRLGLREAVGLLDGAGLQVKLFQASTLSGREPIPPVTRQTIASGAVVSAGTTVGLGFPSMN